MLILDVDLRAHSVSRGSQCCTKRLANGFDINRTARVTSLPEHGVLLLPYVRVKFALINVPFSI